MIEMEGLHHISLSITKLEECKKFYGHILGLPELDRPNFDFHGAWYQIGHQQLHLIVHPKSNTIRKENNIDTKDGHIAIRIKDYDAALKCLQENRVPYKENKGSKSGFKQIFCMDPDYNLIELNVDQD
ncbi:VOC family protein [Lederbergia citrea]|uniref:VOC family protein n=1 Tax=Lederbergia citrea TaxID=2833581 RepID=A0A942Z2G6_9BACI|nr:VOC family protein [Lederbergia citrea]MBS4203972.1 VOC family protein [Lederbergia citrea]MBS4221444.1 VOC family protein [Lederbergia citrea]